MTITQFNKHNLAQISSRLEIALSTIAEETGLDIQLGSCRYQNKSATYKVIVKTVGEDGKVFDEDAANFAVFARQYGLHEQDMGRKFVSNGTEYTICGLKPRAHKYPLLAKNSQGKRYKFGAAYVKRLLGSNNGN